MSIHRITAAALLAALTIIAGCFDRDREQAAKQSDGVDTFRYKPRDMTKYVAQQPSSKAPASSTASASTTSAGAVAPAVPNDRQAYHGEPGK